MSITIDPAIIKQIQDDGVIANNNIWRRWITAQTYKCYIYEPTSYNKRQYKAQSGASSESFKAEYERKFFEEKDTKYALQNLARELKIQKKSTMWPEFVTMDIIRQVMKEYKKSVHAWMGKDPKRDKLVLKNYDGSVRGENRTVLQLPEGTDICKSIICGEKYYTAAGWYNAQACYLSTISYQVLSSSHYVVSKLLREYTFKNKTYRWIDVLTIDENGKYGFDKVLASIMHSIKSPEDFIQLVESDMLSILPMSLPIDDAATYQKVFKAVGAYYTFQNMILFHRYDGITMDEVDKIAKSGDLDKMWETLLHNIDEGCLMDYLVTTQVDEI